MEFLLVLSKSDARLAAAEAVSVFGLRSFVWEGNLLLFRSGSPHLAGRLAYSNTLARVLFRARIEDIRKRFVEFQWSRVYETNFSVRIRNFGNRKLGFSEADLAALVWRRLKNPAVCLKNPHTQILLVVSGNEAYCCLVLSEVAHGFGSRKPSLRPGFSPVSLDPRLARAIVNLTGIRKGVLLDPFCGTGGLLIEAGLMGFKVVGYDVDERMLDRCISNFRHLGISRFSLALQDATTMSSHYDYVVTDLPYGRNSVSTQPIDKLYFDFLSRLKGILGKRAVVVFPDSVDFRPIVRKCGLKVCGEFTHYVHKSLSKRIVVVSP